MLLHSVLKGYLSSETWTFDISNIFEFALTFWLARTLLKLDQEIKTIRIKKAESVTKQSTYILRDRNYTSTGIRVQETWREVWVGHSTIFPPTLFYSPKFLSFNILVTAVHNYLQSVVLAHWKPAMAEDRSRNLGCCFMSVHPCLCNVYPTHILHSLTAIHTPNLCKFHCICCPFSCSSFSPVTQVK